MSQSKPNPQRAQALRNLYEQAQQAAQHSAIRLKRAQAEQTQAEGKLHSLQQFERQYRSQLAELEQRGGSWGAVRDLRAFIDRLGAAQAAQRDEIMNTRTRCEEHLRAW
ncbi:flagellar FliJ family protein, partial [Metallibacterium scheffleri]|uniref:flagellar FliJ family protein n=1 Tax=Metallibacterium scheffleri TaxID=993689 RepID=UPI0026EFADCD